MGARATVEVSEPVGAWTWLVDADDERMAGYARVAWKDVQRVVIAKVKGAGMERASLDSPAKQWFDWFEPGAKLAITDVVLDDPEAIDDLIGYVVEPALRCGVELLVSADRAYAELRDADYHEPEFGYAYALQRLRWQWEGRALSTASPPAALPPMDFPPDPTQQAAIDAPAGVAQIIAPAGSGKTSTMLERARELRRRGVPDERILCVVFGHAVRQEIRARMADAGVRAETRTFNGLAYWICDEADALPMQRTPTEPSFGQWRRLAAAALSDVGKQGVWFEPPDAREALAEIMLVDRLTPEEYAATLDADSDPALHTKAALYRRYVEMQEENERASHNQLMLRAIGLLRDDPEIRADWQRRFEHVLVDEYQDIDPAQELLVRIVAAPHDQLFCVGDEDQTVFAWRRASVQRIVCLDRHYPSLQRFPLGINYRCPPEIVRGSAALIANNGMRFPKTIEPRPGRVDDEAVHVHRAVGPGASAATIADVLAGKVKQALGEIDVDVEGSDEEKEEELRKLAARQVRGRVAVLGRTYDALRTVALACVDEKVPVDGARRLFEPAGARRSLLEHLTLALRPEDADAKLVRSVCSTPGRQLPFDKSKPLKDTPEGMIAAQLKAGASFTEVFAGIEAPKRKPYNLLAPGPLFERLATEPDAARAIALLRDEGGLDAWFDYWDQTGSGEGFEVETLAQAQRQARGMGTLQYLEFLEGEVERLLEYRDDVNGIEFLTMHRSKGRQWPEVIVVACDDGELPHSRANEADAAALARGEGPEAERRLAYVAFTRAMERLDVHCWKPSKYLTEAGFLKP